MNNQKTHFDKLIDEVVKGYNETVQYVTEELGLSATDYDDFHQRLFAINKYVPQYTFIPGPDADPNDENVARALQFLPEFCSDEFSQIILNRLTSRGITDIQRRRMSVANNESKENSPNAESIDEASNVTDDYPFDATSIMSEIYNFAINNSYRIRLRRNSVLDTPEVIEKIRPIFNRWSVDFVSIDDVEKILGWLCTDIYNISGVRAVADDFVVLSNAPMSTGSDGMEPETESVSINV